MGGSPEESGSGGGWPAPRELCPGPGSVAASVLSSLGGQDTARGSPGRGTQQPRECLLRVAMARWLPANGTAGLPASPSLFGGGPMDGDVRGRPLWTGDPGEIPPQQP